MRLLLYIPVKNNPLQLTLHKTYFISKRFYPLMGHAMNVVALAAAASKKTLIPKNMLTIWNLQYKQYFYKLLSMNNVQQKPVYVDNGGFVSSKIISHFDKMLITDCIKYNVATPSTIFEIFTKSKPLVVSGRSGIYAPPPSLFEDSTVPFDLALITCKFVITVMAEEGFNDPVALAFRLGKFLNSSFYVEDIVKFYPMAQHLINSMMANINFPPTVLYEITKTAVDYTFYMNAPLNSSTIIEAHVFEKTLMQFAQKNASNVILVAQNPDNPQADHTKYASQAYELLKQPHPDFRLTGLLNETRAFYDVKMRGHGIQNVPTMKGVLTLLPKFTEKMQLQYIQRARGDLGNVSKKSKEQKEREALDYYIKKIKLLEDNKSLTITQKLKLFEELQNAIDLDPCITSAVCSRIVKAEPDVFFNEIYKAHPEIEQGLKRIAAETKISTLISPQGHGHQIAQVGHWKEFTFKIIAIMPEHLKPLIYKNLLTYYSLES